MPGEYFPKPKETPKSAYPAGKFSGLMFGDYYYYDKWHQDRSAAATRTTCRGSRASGSGASTSRTTYTFSEKFTTRFRLEANSNGQLAGGNLNPYVKDAYLRWTFTGKQALTLGIQPSPHLRLVRGLLGPAPHREDARPTSTASTRRATSALTRGRPDRAMKTLKYAVQYGNESGTGSETDKFKIHPLVARYETNPGIAVEGFYASASDRTARTATTAQGIVGYRGKAAASAGQYLYQERKSGEAAVPDLKIDIWSGFGVWEFLAQEGGRVRPLRRRQGQARRGTPACPEPRHRLPGSEHQAPFTTYIVGVEYYLHPSIRFSPNVEWVTYDDDPDPTNARAATRTGSSGVTFFWTWWLSRRLYAELTRAKRSVHRAWLSGPVQEPNRRIGG